jgi:hypothetical protein
MSLIELIQSGAGGLAAATSATSATSGNEPKQVARIAKVAIAKTQKGRAPRPGRAAYLAPAAWSDAEAKRINERVMAFTARGLEHDQAERLADALVIRDRWADDRRACVECAHLRARWRCANWATAEVSAEALPPDMVATLQRCPGFAKPGTGAPVTMAKRPQLFDHFVPAKGPIERNEAGHAAYLAHTNQCRQCLAAGLGYGERCAAGAGLWSNYQTGANG